MDHPNVAVRDGQKPDDRLEECVVGFPMLLSDMKVLSDSFLYSDKRLQCC